MYENPEDFLDDEEEKQKSQRRWSINKALKMAKMNKTKEDAADVNKDDILDAAKDFNEWIEEVEEDNKKEN